MPLSKSRCSTLSASSSARSKNSLRLRRATIAAALLVLASAPSAHAGQFTAAVYDEVKPSVVRISCSDRAGTGFLWASSDTAVTALHVVAGCGNITVYYESLKVSRPATLAKVLRRADLALLRIANAPAGHVMVVETSQPSLTDPLSTLGYPLQVPSMTPTDLHLRYGGKTLRDIVPDSVANSLSGGSPSLDLEIDNIEGHLLPGHSGAPIFDGQRRLVAIADGGLDNGAAAISWGIPAKFLNQLAASSENTNAPQAPARGGQGTHVLFAAETEVRNLGETTCSGQTLTKLRSASFAQISASVDDPRGMMQLVQYFGVDPSNIMFDVYQHLSSGATLVLPQGAQITQDAKGDCISSDASGRIHMILQLGILASNTQAQSKSSAFEFLWAGNDPQRWLPDPQWTNLMPISRFDGMIVRRRAYAHVSTMPVGFNDKYAFEALAVRNNVFIGAATQYSWTPQMAAAFNACKVNANMPVCRDVVIFLASWVKTVLAIQLTTFPVG
jgi:S1-C subfamily serine protease